LVAESLPNASVKLHVLREGKAIELTVKIQEMPKDMTALASTGEGRGQHALAGVTVESASSDKEGVKVVKVESGSPAQRAGIQEGDYILEINRQVVKDVEDFQRATRKLDDKERILLLIQRGRSTIFLSITP
jgi:S1-C subfamily serine protease